ncbi:MAG: malate permease [Gaiellaceae bacterium]|nr:malate permease [Gaiellaceae bacterium]
MLGQSLLLLVFLLAGAAVQMAGAPTRLRDAVWVTFFWTFSPVLVFVTFLTVNLNEGLGRALAAAILASWLVGLAGYAYARRVAAERDERGALTLAAGFANTGFVGFPLAQLAFGADGLALAVLYDRLAWLVPASSISTTIARLHGRRRLEVSPRHRLRALLANPPLHAFWLALVLRATGVDVPGTASAQHLMGTVIGPYGFFLLGLSLIRERAPQRPQELRRAAGAVAIRFAGGPLALLGTATLLGANVPGVFFLLAAMPSAFHVLILARVYDVRPLLLNRIVVGTTIPAVALVVLVTGIMR